MSNRLLTSSTKFLTFLCAALAVIEELAGEFGIHCLS
jgi:hypothetical protein